MQYGNDPERRRLVGQTVAQARRRSGGRKDSPAARRAETAIRALYANVALDDLEEIPPADLAGAALALLDFAGKRKPDQPKLRAYTPQAKRDGWSAECDVIEIINDDMPFLVDSVTAELDRLGVTVILVLHPVVEASRDKNGKLTAVGEGSERPSAQSESWMQIRVNHQYDKDRLRHVVDNLERVLRDVRHAVSDWRKMLARANEAIAELEDNPPPVDDDEIRESVAFLNWLLDNHFTFLGYREYTLVEDGSRYDLVERSGLGLLRSREVHVFQGLSDEDTLPPEVQSYIRQPQLVMINKANHRSTVHRPVQLDTIGVKRYGPDGEVVGERRFVGLFTSSAYAQRPQQIPLLRQKVRRMIERAGFDHRSHDGKVLIHVLDHFPRDELFQIGEDDLFEISLGILQLQERHRVALFLRTDPFERFISAQVFAPRERYDTRLRVRFSEILAAALQGEVTSFQTEIADDSALARVQFIVATQPGNIPEYDRQEIEARLAEAARTWTDALTEALVAEHGESKGSDILKRFADAFPTAYVEDHTAGDGVFDIAMIEAVQASDRLDSHLYRRDWQAEHELCLKIYCPGSQLPLADMMPVLEHMGLRAISEVPYEVDLGEDGAVWLHTFSLRSETDNAIAIDEVEPLFREALRRIFAGELENDGFNRLVLAPGLDWREVGILRAYAKYLRQARIRFSQDYMEETLGRHPEIAEALVALFHARFDPDRDTSRNQRVAGLTGGIRRQLEHVRSADEDVIISRFLNAIEATLRTNHYQPGADGGPKGYLSFKLDSRLVDDLPLPRPMYEIFVYAPRFEGVHLRGGKVARGGLRWSDRREDFRTEILGLMKAQMVKNAVIVPVGSKGGFVLKQPPPAAAGREAMQEEGIACYKLFISGLLDLTDNLDGARIVPPKRVVRYDDDDPYLVVAADKGTATFSDIANGVAADYGFWLDDAFASGGSAGYDHKAMGITARGAWESVKRHFRELDHDVQREDFTVIGVGDMSGDVFGNGMLQSKHIRLIGAFNHLHIFIDPNPDPATGFKERQRLFRMARSSWEDYDKRLISKGGGIFERSAKSIRLTPEMRRLLGLSGDRATPGEVVRALLSAQADLLWFGGIGTYVRHSEESDAEVGDRANDAIRIGADALGCKVIGEGANLGMTQRARIEAALHGVRLNTDAIDNSAGVDCSDHEVNIKILLGQVERAGKLKRPERNKLLARMTDEVAELVLRDNYAQTLGISVESAQAHRILDRHVRLLRRYERAGRLNRRVEYLPDDETLEERRGRGLGLTRPELAVVLSYAKINFYADVLDSDLPDEAALADALVGYFPQPLQETYAAQIREHRLNREIAATWITNSMINRAGSTFVTELQEDTGASPDMIARAYFITRDAFSLRPLWDRIEALDNKVAASAQVEMLQAIRRLINRTTLWFLRFGGDMRDLSGTAKRLGDCVAALGEHFERILPHGDRERLRRRMARYTGAGVPEALARDVAALEDLAAACDVERLAGRYGRDVKEVAQLYFALGNRFGLEWLREGARRLPADSPWEIRAIATALEDLDTDQRELTATVLADGWPRDGKGKGNGKDAGGLAPEAVIEDWIAHNNGAIDRIDSLLSELRAVGGLDIAMLTVAGRELKSMIPQ